MTPILSVTLAPPTIATSGWPGSSRIPGQRPHLALQQQAGRALVLQARHALRRGVRPVGGAEGVVDVDVAQPRVGLSELRVVLRLARLVAHVLEREDVAREQLVGVGLHLRADDRRRQRDVGSRQLGHPVGGRAQRARYRSFGRPRCAARITRAPRSRSVPIVGSAARMRVSSVIAPPSSGTLKSNPHERRAVLHLDVVERPHGPGICCARSTTRLE